MRQQGPCLPRPPYANTPTSTAPSTANSARNRASRDAGASTSSRAHHAIPEYRTAPAFQDVVLEAYSFNDHALKRFQERLKDAIDPNGIVSAGRYGIWPSHLRGA